MIKFTDRNLAPQPILSGVAQRRKPRKGDSTYESRSEWR